MQANLVLDSESGAKISATLSDPNKAKSIVILAHGFMSNKDRSTYTDLETAFNKKNIATLRFDFYGHGDSTGEIEDITITKAIQDFTAVINFTKEKGYEKIGLMGASFGGHIAMLVSTFSSSVNALGLRCPVGNYKDKVALNHSENTIEKWKKEGIIEYNYFRGKTTNIKYEYYESICNYDGYKYAEKVRVPTLIVHGDEDEDAPYQQSVELLKHLKYGKLETIYGGDHKLSNPEDYQKAIELFVSFFITNL